MSGEDGNAHAAEGIADGFIAKRDIAIRGWDPIISRLGLKGKRVLLVDDNSRAAKTYADYLSFDCSAVEYFSDVAEALRRYPEFRPDVVITDTDMPDMNGVEFARRLRELEKGLPNGRG